MRTPSVRARWRGWLLPLALAVLAAQWLGLVHGVVHGPGTGVAQVQAPSRGPVAHGDAHAELGDLFAGHDEVACRLADAIGHDAAPLIAAPLLPLLPPAAALPRLAHGEACARWAALFDARAPPAAVS